MFPSQADAIGAHVGCLGMGSRMPMLARALGIDTEVLTPRTLRSPNTVDLPEHGLRLVLRYDGQEDGVVPDADQWYISDALFSAPWGLGVPFGLNVQSETPEWIIQKLGDETQPCTLQSLERGDRRQSFFLEGGGVVEITWKPRQIGISRIWVVRMGRPLDSPPMPPSAPS